jgi:ABC-type dipeptide/oligopeptide/nickel transport system permease component
MLALGSVLLAAVPALPLGIWASLHRKQWFSHLGPAGAIVLQGMPTFVVAVWLQTYVGEAWRLLPSGGWTSPASAVLPTVALAAGNLAYLTKFMQAGMTAALTEDYVTGARARGLSRLRIVLRHAFRPALLSTVTFFGTQTAYLINNTVVISLIFGLPGLSSALGETMYGGAPPGTFPGLADPFGTSGNRPVVFFLSALFTMLFNLIVDMTYRFLDPRAQLTI